MYSREKLEKLLEHAKMTTQSIQKLSQWMLANRQHLDEMVEVWGQKLREGDADNQIVCLYVANDAMQVGVRKFGRHIAAVFEEKLVDIVQFVMRDGEEKVKRCAIKIVGIWKERNVVTAALLAMLENVCAGKPPVEPQVEVEKSDDRVKLLQEMTSESAVEKMLEDLPEVPESTATTQVATHLQELVNATISADMLSDRMFQLESSISVFHHACGEEDDENEVVKDEGAGYKPFPTTGGVAWSKMDQQVYDLDLDRSRGHVQQYRDNLQDQTAKREAVMQKLRALEKMDLFSLPVGTITEEEAGEQERVLERLYNLACDAEAQELKQLEEQRAEFSARQASIAASATDPLYNLGYQENTSSTYHAPTTPTRGRSSSSNDHHSYSNGHRSYGYDHHDRPHRSSPTPLRRHNSASAVTERAFDDRYNDHHRYEKNDRYGYDSPSSSKRPKLHHAHSMESQNVQWQEASRYSPRGGAPTDHYAAVERERTPYSPRDNAYSPRGRMYQPPSHERPRRSRWDSMPEDRYNSNHYDDHRRW
ncbi:Regulation of nuclear pre-mRNA domain containing protein 1B [Phytophthora boehmeriae]|uniref:Regulation of nuclear pre-mRNA domain containing protein 1B n=1 Tax=Phytophthora boehmeriae TaxID=109152 RepID=A0A8T1WU53_9STRA|nr:Regulation of nuclear pre-mRNA domain containing protein 1B [Phytophthora boehmeriae]